MPEDKPKKKKPPSDGKPKTSPDAAAPGPALPPGGPDPMMTGAGVPPPMPGQGLDPYAALAGQISTTPPMGQPGLPGMGGDPGMGTGPGGMSMAPGGGPGMGPGPGMGGGAPLQGGPPVDPIMHALSASSTPMSFPPDMSEHAVDPPPEQMQENMSLQQILTLLSMLQAGIPNSGLTPPARPGSVATGMLPMQGGML